MKIILILNLMFGLRLMHFPSLLHTGSNETNEHCDESGNSGNPAMSEDDQQYYNGT